MTTDSLFKVLLAAFSLCAGAYFTALRNKIASLKVRNNLHWSFYILSFTTFVIAVFYLCNNWNELSSSPSSFIAEIIITASSIIISFIFFRFNYKNHPKKIQYKTNELTDLINEFTKNADKNVIKLLAGDIDFFGATPEEMDTNPQYICLKESGFHSIELLCWQPQSPSQRIRYGKMISDFPRIQIKFYQPPTADFNLRGRLKTFNNVRQLILFNKVRSGIYEPVEADAGSPHGAHYVKLWDLIWELAIEVDENDKKSFTQEYKRV